MTGLEVQCASDAPRSLSAAKLATLKRLSIRKGVWSCLTGVERGIVNLSIKLVKNIRSRLLSATLQRVVAKLSQAIKSGYLYKFEVLGKPIAERISELFYLWGNKNAIHWKDDLAYVRHLGMDATFSRGYR